MTNKDVELRIRAKDTASKAIREVGTALDQLAQAQKDISESGSGSSSLLGQLGKEFNRLSTDIKRLSDLGGVKKELDSLGTSLQRSSDSIRQSRQEISRSITQYEEAGRSIKRLSQDIDRSNQSIEQQQAALQKPRREYRSLVRQLDEAVQSYDRLSREVNESSQASAESVSELRSQGNALVELQRQVKESNASLQTQEKVLKDLREVRKGEKRDLRALENTQARLRREIQTSNASIQSQNDIVRRTRAEYQKLENSSNELSSGLVSASASQERVAQASRQAVQDVERLTQAFERQRAVQAATMATDNTGSAQAATQQYRQQVQAVEQAERAFREARNEATKLGQEISKTTEPNRRLQTSFVLAKEAALSARQEYERQAAELNQLRGVTQSSFATFSRFASSTQSASASLGQLSQRASSSTASLNRLRDSFRSLQGSASGLRNVLLGAGAALLSLSSSTNAAGTAIRSIRGQVIGLTASYLGFFAAFREIGEVVNAFRTLEAAQNRLNVVFEGDGGRVTEEIRFLRSEAQRLGVEFGVLSAEYSKFAVAADAANFSQQGVRDIFLSVAEAGVVNKLSTEDLNGVFVALTQIIGKGTFSLEELRQQLGERLPGSLQILIDALGLTSEEFFKLVEAGDLTADENNLLKFADGLNERFGPQLEQALKSTNSEIGRFQNNIFNIRSIIADSGFIDAFTNSLRELNEALSSDEGADFFRRLGSALGGLVEVFTAVIRNIDLVITALQTFLAIRFAQRINGWLGGQKALANNFSLILTASRSAVTGVATFLASLNVATLRQFGASLVSSVSNVRNLGGAFTSLAGRAAAAVTSIRGLSVAFAAALPVALALTAVFAPGIFFDYITEADRAEQATFGLERALQKISDQVRAAKGDFDEAAKSLSGISEVQIQDNLDEFRDRLEDVSQELDISVASLGLEAEFEPTQRAIEGLITEFKAGSIGAEQFQASVTELLLPIERGESSLKVFTSGIRDSIRELVILTENVDKSEAILNTLKGTYDEATKEALGFADAQREVAESTSSIDVSTYEKNLNRLLRRTKEGKKELEEEAIRTDASNAIDAVLGESGEVLDVSRVEAVLKAEQDALNALNERSSRTRKPRETDEERAARKQIENQIRFNNQLLQESQDRQFQLNQLTVEEARQRQINEAVQQAKNRAQRSGVDITQEQIDLIKQETAALFDAQNARLPLEQAEARVNDLLETRTLLQERIRFLRESGDANSLQAADELQSRLGGVEAQLVSSIDKAIQLAQALGDDNLVLNLENTKLSIEQTGQSAVLAGSQINQSFAQGGANVIDQFSQAVANGENAFRALGDAARQFFSDFLRQIAQAIAQQAILNALGAGQGGGVGQAGGGGVGGVLSTAIGSIFHEGGVVGRSSAPTRAVPSALFASARRYHDGGLPGLKSDEVPAILQRNEEVLASDDPRNVLNGGGSSSNIKIVNAIDSGNFVSEGLSTTEGEKAVLNFMRNNSSAVRGSLGV